MEELNHHRKVFVDMLLVRNISIAKAFSIREQQSIVFFFSNEKNKQTNSPYYQ